LLPRFGARFNRGRALAIPTSPEETMDSPELIDDYLIRSGLEFDTVDEGMWIIHDDIDHVDNIVVSYSPPIVVFRVKLMDSPRDPEARGALFEQLLRLNATAMVSGAYALEDGAVIATETLQSENLDLNEFQAAIDGLTQAIVEHYDQLKSFHHAADKA
jgi:hypothetical protein